MAKSLQPTLDDDLALELCDCVITFYPDTVGVRAQWVPYTDPARQPAASMTFEGCGKIEWGRSVGRKPCCTGADGDDAETAATIAHVWLRFFDLPPEKIRAPKYTCDRALIEAEFPMSMFAGVQQVVRDKVKAIGFVMRGGNTQFVVDSPRLSIPKLDS